MTEVNPWIYYAMPLHRMQEFDFHDKVFDLMNERLLSRRDLRAYASILLGLPLGEVPDPNED